MVLIDTHTHLYLPEFEKDIQNVIKNAQDEGIQKFFLPAIDSRTHEAMLALEANHADTCVAMMGLHPCSVKADYKKELDIIAEYWSNRRFCAIGEIGLDYYWSTEFIKEQKQALRTQINWAKEWNVPIVLHARDSLDDIIEMISEEKTDRLVGIFHCFGGTIAQAKSIIDLGFLIGIGGVATYQKAGLDKVLPEIGLEHLVLETDSPYLTPVPHRGKRNESAYIKIIAKRVAKIMNTDMSTVANITTKNALELFKTNMV